MGKRLKTPEEVVSEYDKILKTVGLRLREARMKAGLTQSQLGEKAQMKQSYIFELETGGSNITLRTLAKMADVLELDVRDLLPGSSAAPHSSSTLTLLQSLLERVSATLVEWQAQDARRESQKAEFLAELRSFADLRFSLEKAPEPHHVDVQMTAARPGQRHSRSGSKPTQ